MCASRCSLPASRPLLWYTLLWCRQVVFCPPHTMQASSCCFEPKMKSQPGVCTTRRDSRKHLGTKVSAFLRPRVDIQHSNFIWPEPWQLPTFPLVLSLPHIQLKTQSPLSVLLLFASPCHFLLLNIYFRRKNSSSGPLERRICGRAVSVHVKMPEQRAPRMSRMVYGERRTLLLERLQWTLSSQAFPSPALESKPIKGEVPRQESNNLGSL